MAVFNRPLVVTRNIPLLRPRMAPAPVAGMLGDLGDLLDGSGANGGLADFRLMLETHISAKAGANYLANAKAAPNLAGAINLAANAFRSGNAGTLDATAQASWNQWKNAAQDPNSDYNIYWMFGSLVSMSADQLVAAWAEQNKTGWWSDPDASQVSYTLMDTSTSGTNWIGGTVTTSKLTNQQWGTLWTKAWTFLQKGITKQLLPLTMLDVLCRGMLQAPAARKFPLFQAPPGNLSATDPKAIAFRSLLKDLGYSDLVKEWYSYTAQAWAAQNAASEQQDAAYASVITGLSWASGAAVVDQITSKLKDYWQVRSDAAAAIKAFNVLAQGPLGDRIPAADKTTMAGLTQQFLDTDARASSTLTPIGLWPADQVQGNAALNGLGIGQLVLAGILAVTALGVVAYIVATMTATARAAAAQTKATADSILATVDALKSSCENAYMASTKDAAAEKAYQDCLLQTKALTDSIPEVPEVASDPMGLGKITMLVGIAVVGIIAIGAMKRNG